MVHQVYNSDADFPIFMDQNDPLRKYRGQYHFPTNDNGIRSMYFCGNSLGIQPKAAKTEVDKVMADWARLGVKGHFSADEPWMEYQNSLKKSMADLFNSLESEVAIANTLTSSLHNLLISFYRPQSSRYKVLMENKAFPSDRYAVKSHLRLHGYSESEGIHEVPTDSSSLLISTENIINEIETRRDELALVLLGGINYYTGQFFNIKEIAAKANEFGIPIGLDLAHVAGNVPIDLHSLQIDFACWCTYKYLNGGPGSTSGFFVHEKHFHKRDISRLEGWWGNRLSTRFDMAWDFDPSEGAEAWVVSNPSILAVAPLKASLAHFDELGMEKIRNKSILLTGYLEYLLQNLKTNRIKILSPQNASERGSQLSLEILNADKSLYFQLMENNVVLDWREPGVIRVAPAPLYNSFQDVYQFVRILNSLL